MARHPYMDVGLRRWIAAFARENHWRVAQWIELEDLIQEGWACYAKVARRPEYRGLAKRHVPTKNNRKVFMALVKRTFSNRIHDLAYDRGPENNVASLLGPDQNHDDWLAAHGAVEGAVADLCTVLGRGALKELGRLASLLHSDVVEGEAYLKYRVGDTWRRETNVEYVCRLAGYDLRDKPRGQDPNYYILSQLGLAHLENCVDIVEVLGDHFGVKVAS